MISRTNIAAIVSYHLRFRGTAMIVRTLDKAVGLADLGVQRFAAKRTKSESDGTTFRGRIARGESRG